MATVPYITRQEVREEAGFQHPEENGSLTGAINGVNKVFMTEHKPIVGRRYINTISVEDVTVYVDGSPVSLQTLDYENGVVTIETAPADDVALSIYYHHSQLSDTYVDKLIAEATGIVHRCLRSNGISIPFDSENDNQAPYYPTIQMIVRLYAAGLALTRDYGSNADTEETSKDGYKKMSTAKKELMELCEALKLDELIPSSGSEGSGGTVEVTNQGKIFSDLSGGIVDGERQGFGGRAADPHEAFFRKG